MVKPLSTAPSIAPDEVAQFSRLAEEWWSPEGAMGILHRMNPVRLTYIRDQICARHHRLPSTPAPLKGLRLLDIGCGGGLLSEPLSRMGAQVTGLDASRAGIAAAKAHAEHSGLSIDYHACSAEEWARTGQHYDIVTAMEIVEHVADLPSLLAAAAQLLKPQGLLFLSTVNRTPASFLKAIVAAEYILGWVPKGTHTWRKFVKPSELGDILEHHQITITDMAGVIYNPLTHNFACVAGRVGNTYILTTQKKS